MSVLPNLVAGFTVIPVAYANSTHILYARAHRSNSENAAYPPGRTLFLVNVPVDATDREISLFFSYCGTVERVVYDLQDPSRDGDADVEGDTDADAGTDASDAETASSPPPPPSSPDKHAADAAQPGTQRDRNRKRRATDKKGTAPPAVVPLPPLPTRMLHKTGGLAHVVFLDSSSLNKALVHPSPSSSAAPPTPRPWPSPSSDRDPPRGLAHYAALYDAQRPPLDVVKAHADSWMVRFEYDRAQRATVQTSAYRKGEAIVDADGFTLVTRGGAYGKTPGGGVGVARRGFGTTGRSANSRKRKKEPKEKVAFYAFQKAERQRQALLDLRKNFEADKARIEKLKESRRFKPY